MALEIYTYPSVDSVITSDGTGLTPFRISVDGNTGGTIVLPFYVRNNNKDHWYSSITVVVVDESTGSLYSTLGWTWKLISSIHEPKEEEWASLSSGNTVSLSNIGTSSEGDTAMYLPVWVEVNIPRGLLGQNILDVVIRISATKGLVS
jgi:hypothetical protein